MEIIEEQARFAKRDLSNLGYRSWKKTEFIFETIGSRSKSIIKTYGSVNANLKPVVIKIGVFSC